jgi:hypothetical protein
MRQHVERNAHVTVVLRDTGEIVHAHVKKPGKELRVVFVRERAYTSRFGGDGSHRTRVNYNVRHRDEGIVWARGWEGPAVDALRAYVALTTGVNGTRYSGASVQVSSR